MAMEGKHVFGGVLIPRFKFVRKKHGEDGFEELIRAMNDKGYPGPEDEGLFKNGKRYPFSYLYIFLETYLDLYGKSEFSIMNRAVAHKKGVVGFFVKWLGSPEKMIEKAGDYWSNFYDFGELDGRLLEENKGILTGKDISPKPLFCMVLTDYFRGISECVNAADFKIDHTHCVHRGDSKCIWEISWGKRKGDPEQKI